MKFSIITSAFGVWGDVRKLIGCVAAQYHHDWEMVIVCDGRPDDCVYRAIRVCPQSVRDKISVIEQEKSATPYGNLARNRGLERCSGDYVCWVNHDNIIFPNYLSGHAANIESAGMDCVSVLPIEYWSCKRYVKRIPSANEDMKIDLLCSAMPLSLAKEINAFGGWYERRLHSDWYIVWDAAKRVPVVRADASAEVFGIHF